MHTQNFNPPKYIQESIIRIKLSEKRIILSQPHWKHGNGKTTGHKLQFLDQLISLINLMNPEFLEQLFLFPYMWLRNVL